MASVDLIELLLEVHYKVGVSDWAKMNGWDFTSWKWWPGAESNHRAADFQYDGEPGSVAPSRRPGRVFCSADRTAPPDRTYPEPEA
jgi:hypothetical protein